MQATQNTAAAYNAAAIAQYVQKDSKGFTLHIDVSAKNLRVNGAQVQSISMFVAHSEDDGDGDLAVNWNTDGLTNNAAADTMGALLLRDIDSEDDVTNTMELFYFDKEFDEELRQLLQAAGFSKAAADAVSGSEWGMQDEGRASYDANEIANEVRAALA